MALLMQWIGGLSSRLLLVVFVISAAQFPLYYLAYSNTLAGARAESEARFTQLQQEAAALQLDVETFIQRHEVNSDETFRASGRIHRTTVQRYRRYTAMESALREAVIWQRPWVLARNFDPVLHAATRFEPGVPLTLEGGAYALAGFLLAWVLTGLAGVIFMPKVKPRI